MQNALDYDLTKSVLEKADCVKSPSEVHGILCGLLCLNEILPRNWPEFMFGQYDSNDLLFQEACTHIETLHHHCLEQINDPGCDFHLLLPDEASNLDDKILALGDWCQGFILGLNEGGIKQLENLPENGREFVQDLLEISRINHNYEYEDNNETETSLEQFVEYIRVGVLLLNEELHPTPPSQPYLYN